MIAEHDQLIFVSVQLLALSSLLHDKTRPALRISSLLVASHCHSLCYTTLVIAINAINVSLPSVSAFQTADHDSFRLVRVFSSLRCRRRA